MFAPKPAPRAKTTKRRRFDHVAEFKIGDHVRLVRLEDWFFKGISAEQATFLRSCIGGTARIGSFDEQGHVELEFRRSASNVHFISVDQSWIEKV
jgi:hypothetical protein